MTDKRYSKVEEEIIQILDKMEEPKEPEQPANLVAFRPRPKPKPPKRQMPSRSQIGDVRLLQRVRRYSAGSWVGVGIVAALVAWQLGRFLPALGFVAMMVSVAAFLAALYTRRSGPKIGYPGSSPTTKRWRGRDIDLTEPRQRPGQPRERFWGKRFRGPRS